MKERPYRAILVEAQGGVARLTLNNPPRKNAIGPAMINASTDEYNVPQMNGRAPNSPAIGSHVSVCQNCQPNFQIAAVESV